MSTISHFFALKDSKKRKLSTSAAGTQSIANVQKEKVILNDVIVIDDDDDDEDGSDTLVISPEAFDSNNESIICSEQNSESLFRRAEYNNNSSNAAVEIVCNNIQSHPGPSTNEENSNTKKNDEEPFQTDNVDLMRSQSNTEVNLFAKFAFGQLPSIQRPVQLSLSVEEKQSNNSKGRMKEGKKSEKCEFISIKKLSLDEQNEIIKKWFSLLDFSITTNIEDRRFQLFVAARLHARCQECGVRKAMKKLYETIIPFTVNNIAKINNPNEFINCITNLQYYNSKTKQIIQASNQIINEYNGIVPENEYELIKLIGIGPVFADLLAFVNTREMHMVNNGNLTIHKETSVTSIN